MLQIIYLIGMPGCGKSTLGKKLAKQLDCKFIDLDQRIEQTTGRSIEQIFELEGEEIFRKIEQEILFTCLPTEPTIIACGGGTPAYEMNMNFINKHGISVYLKANETFLWDRLSAKNDARPLFKGLSSEDCRIKITNLLAERKFFYEQATHIFSLPIKDFKSLKDNILNTIKTSKREYL